MTGRERESREMEGKKKGQEEIEGEREEGKRPVVEGRRKGKEGMERKGRKESGGEPPLRSERRAVPPVLRALSFHNVNYEVQRLAPFPAWHCFSHLESLRHLLPLSIQTLILSGPTTAFKARQLCQAAFPMTRAQRNHFLFKLQEHPSSRKRICPLSRALRLAGPP